MMELPIKTALIALNTHYSHCSLAIRLLEKCMTEAKLEVVSEEWTINQPFEELLASLFLLQADVYCFSCSIWNRELIQKLAPNLKKVRPCVIVLGGPEVSYSSEDCLTDGVDYVVCGEGDEVLPKLIGAIAEKRPVLLPTVCYRGHGATELAAVKDISLLGTPYTQEELQARKDKLFYYESSRGCPYACSFCLSSLTRGVRFVREEVVLADMAKMVRAGMKIVKFTDRTFNCNPQRAMSLFRGLAALEGNCVFHFEMCAHLIDQEMLAFLKTVQPGRFQFEIGLQSVSDRVIAAVNRTTDTEAVLETIATLYSFGNIHIHVDLIAGLPFETLDGLQKSFDRAYGICHMLQLGFLKMLRGTSLRCEAARYDYRFCDRPPYEIFSNQFLSYSELLQIKQTERVLERYQNSGFFCNSLPLLKREFQSAFAMFLALGAYFDSHRAAGDVSLKTCFALLWQFDQSIRKDDFQFLEHLRMDYILKFRDSFPEYFGIQYEQSFLKARKAFLCDSACMSALLGKKGGDVGYRNRFCEIHRFTLDDGTAYLLFNREEGTITDITERFIKRCAN